MSSKVSIIVPVYNVEKYIHQCVESLLAQTYQNMEVVLVNDGSPDRCPEKDVRCSYFPWADMNELNVIIAALKGAE